MAIGCEIVVNYHGFVARPTDGDRLAIGMTSVTQRSW